MIEDKKIYSKTPDDWFTPANTNRPKSEIFETQDKECIYSKGYPGGINFEFYPNKKQLNIFYPFPTFEEMTDLEIEYYTEHAYGPEWHHIEPNLEWDCCDIGELEVNEKRHEVLLEYFIAELKTKDGLSSYMITPFSHTNGFIDLSKNKSKRLDELLSQFLKANSLEHYCHDATEDDFNIIYCQWKVKKKFNDNGYLDIEVSIQLPEYHNEFCKVLCSNDARYNIEFIFGHCNCIDGRMDDGKNYGVYCNLNFDKDYLELEGYEHNEDNDDIQFPWNRDNRINKVWGED